MNKNNRLKNRRDFSIVYRHGKSVANRQFALYVLKNPRLSTFRLGISASKKLGHAVTRNRMRRLIKEIIRLRADQLPTNYDFVIIIRRSSVEMEYLQLEKSISHLFHVAKTQKLFD